MNIHRRAFTLIELLVVISVIAILTAILLPVLRESRESGRATQCVAHLRALASANLTYARDNEGRYCFAQKKDNNQRWHGTRTGSETPFDPSRGPLAPYLGREGRIHACPSHGDLLIGEDSFENGAGGYGYNAVYIGGTPADKWQGEYLANVPNPARTVMFADTAFSRKNGLQEYPFAEPWQWVRPNGRLAGALAPSVHFRHRGHAHVAWCDGHVSAEKPSRLGGSNIYGGNDAAHMLGWFGPEAENGYWNPSFREELQP